VTPIAAYLEELAGLLPWTSRRRIVAEVGAHLHEAAALRRAGGEGPDVAELGAVTRFGAPAEIARQFNALRARPAAIARQALAVSLAAAATGGLGSATVWALEPGAHAHAAQRAHAELQRERGR